jgi:hypothetical protein
VRPISPLFQQTLFDVEFWAQLMCKKSAGVMVGEGEGANSLLFAPGSSVPPSESNAELNGVDLRLAVQLDRPELTCMLSVSLSGSSSFLHDFNRHARLGADAQSTDLRNIPCAGDLANQPPRHPAIGSAVWGLGREAPASCREVALFALPPRPPRQRSGRLVTRLWGESGSQK